MITYIKMRYILVILASCTALIYFLAAHQDAEELTNPDLNSQKRLGTQVEYALFVIVGVGYASMSVWILVGKLNMIIPYSIITGGSILLIGIYSLAITIGVPIMGVEDDSDILATVSKMLQASIISITAILIFSAGERKGIPKIENHGKNCILCGRQIVNELSSVTLMPDGTEHVFDSDICMKYFQKLNSVYGVT
jgi:hypothetical protein